MFERFRKEAPELQVYGKLPLAKDYLRVGASKGSGRDLREWLDHAFSSLAVQGEAPHFAWPARFVLGAAKGEPLMGAAWPSSDRGGERDFPFAVFVSRRPRALASAFEEGLDRLVPVWQALSECYPADERFADGQSFLAAMRGRTVPIEEAHQESQPQIPWEAWLEALWPDAKQAGLVELLVSLARLGRQRDHGPLRLPLVANLPMVPQVHGWWSALVALGIVETASAPTVFFPLAAPQDLEPRFATFLVHPLQLEDALWMDSARTRTPLGPGDFAKPHQALAAPSAAVPEGAPSLALSMRGALATARSRS